MRSRRFFARKALAIRSSAHTESHRLAVLITQRTHGLPVIYLLAAVGRTLTLFRNILDHLLALIVA